MSGSAGSGLRVNMYGNGLPICNGRGAWFLEPESSLYVYLILLSSEFGVGWDSLVSSLSWTVIIDWSLFSSTFMTSEI